MELSLLKKVHPPAREFDAILDKNLDSGIFLLL
jgi:hypothetical protein